MTSCPKPSSATGSLKSLTSSRAIPAPRLNKLARHSPTIETRSATTSSPLAPPASWPADKPTSPVKRSNSLDQPACSNTLPRPPPDGTTSAFTNQTAPASTPSCTSKHHRQPCSCSPGAWAPVGPSTLEPKPRQHPSSPNYFTIMWPHTPTVLCSSPPAHCTPATTYSSAPTKINGN